MKKTIKSPFLEEIYENARYSSPIKSLLKKPYIIDVESTNNCNMSCLFCDRQIMERGKGFMDEKIFQTLVDQSQEIGVKGLRFIRWGEHYLHPKIFEFIDYAKKRNLLVHVTTNGKLMNQERAEQTIKSGLDHLIFSFQGVNKKSYEEMRGKGNYNIFEKNVKSFMKLRNTLSKDKPFVQITTSTTNESPEEVEEFKKYWGGIVDLVTHTGTTSLYRVEDQDRIKKSGVLNKEKRWDRDKVCYEVFKKLAINWNGDFTACANDFDNNLLLGNIKDYSINDIWTSEKLKEIRKTLKKNDKKEVKEKIPFCGYCRNRF